jgi:aminoacrylate hydrolase
MAKVNSGGVEIDYEVLNAESSAIPIFLMSGLAGLRGAWGNQLEAFTKRGPVVLHDHRGTGKSAKPLGVYSIENMAADMVAIMDAVGAGKGHFIGSSTGGATAQVLCIDHPGRVQSAVICSSWAKADHFFTRTFDMRKIILRELGNEVYTRDSSITLMGPQFFNENYDAIVKTEDERIQNAPPVEVAIERIDCIMAHDQLGRLGRIQAPVLVAVAKDDAVTPPPYSEQLAAAIPGAELKIFDEGGHLFYMSKPAGFNAAILDFIGRHEP